MREQMYLTVLGGAQKIGASSYCLTAGKEHLLVDCGSGIRDGMCYGPDFTALTERGISPKDISALFITHAHYDHVGYLPNVRKLCGNMPAYASRLTKSLAEFLLSDREVRNYRNFKAFSDFQIAVTKALQTVSTVSYATDIDLGSVRATAYEAGHVPGAAMYFFQCESGTALFTGDFSLSRTALTNGADVPENIRADTVIIDGTYAKRPDYLPLSADTLSLQSFRYADRYPIAIRVNQMTKGLELMNLLYEQMQSGRFPQADFYVDGSILTVADAFMEQGFAVLPDRCHLATPEILDRCPRGIYILMQPVPPQMCEVRADFSLHADFRSLREFIARHAKKNVVVVHSPYTENAEDFYALENSFGGELNFMYPEVGETYYL